MKDPASRLRFGSVDSGVYAAPASIVALRQSAEASGMVWFELDLAGVVDKATFLSRCQTVFQFPATFGHNWDALADCLQDLSWQPGGGYIVSCSHGKEFARGSQQEFAVALDICAATALYWQARNRVFMVLVDEETRGERRLATLRG